VIIRIVAARPSPIARSSPSSRVRSITDSASVLTMPSTAMRIASASRIWIITRIWSSPLVCCSVNRAWSTTDTSGLSATSFSTDGCTCVTDVPGTSWMNACVGCGTAKSRTAASGSTYCPKDRSSGAMPATV
jgi:hypothetical protein